MTALSLTELSNQFSPVLEDTMRITRNGSVRTLAPPHLKVGRVALSGRAAGRRRRQALLVVCTLLLGLIGGTVVAPAAAAAPAAMPLMVDFGAASTVPAAGYVLDYGQPYGARTGANQGTGNTYGWISNTTAEPANVSANGRVRTGTGETDIKQTTLMHMQLPAANPVAWQAEVANGWYTVAVGLGDAYPVYDSTHSVTVEGQYPIAPYTPTSANRLKTGTVTVLVSDGTLTVRPQGGTNVKITFVSISDAESPGGSSQFPFRVDFGAASSTPAAGYILDFGQRFGPKATGDYGWVTTGTATPLDLVATGRQRAATSSSDPRLTNFIHMQYPGLSAGDWRMTVPNGTYRVTVGVGEANNIYDSQHAISVEGQSIVAPYTPTFATKFKQGTVDVVVTDGNITVSAAGGANTKITWLEILDWANPPTPQLPLKVDFGTSASPMPAGYLNDSGQSFGARSGGYTFGWVNATSGDPQDMTLNGRLRYSTYTTDPKLLSLVQMQWTGSPASGNTNPGAWEVSLPTGTYSIKVGAGDAATAFDSAHSINVENTPLITTFGPSSNNRIREATGVVSVADGRLTVNALGGTNTKILYIEIDGVDSNRPRVSSVAPGGDEIDVVRDLSITTELVLPNGAINPNTVNNTNVTLKDNITGVAVPASVNTSGGGDVLVLTPNATLAANTMYRYEITDGVKDVAGNSFLPFLSLFKTGTTVSGTGIEGVAFDQEDTVAQGQMFTSTTVGPDNKLYAATLNGFILRYDIAADGTLSNEQTIDTVRSLNADQDRTIIGLAFDPAATADNLILWVTDNYMYTGSNNVPDWSSKVDRLTGPDLENGEVVIDGLPRSAHDHEANSIAFGPDGALYFPMGSNTGMGYQDIAWANRPEVLLSGAVLRVDLDELPAQLPLDVKTVEGGGTYDPYAADAPVTLYATGVRNAFDLLWHSNGQLYAPTNGSAAGANIPAVANPLPASCSTTRSDVDTAGPYTYTGPTFATLFGNPQAQTDFIHKVTEGGYYGHPNPSRCEYISYGGNPTSGADAWEETMYPVGVQPDRNYRAADVYDAGLHASANGTIEYQSDVFGDLLQGKILIVRYSASKDIEVADPSGPNGAITGIVTGVTGFTGFSEPLDITENPDGSGILYVTELGGFDIKLLRPNVG
jgi:hypothetical protein